MNFFPKNIKVSPTIYAYEENSPDLKNFLKVGYTNRSDPRVRIKEQFPLTKPGNQPWKLVFQCPAVRNDGSTFTDKDVHKVLKYAGRENVAGEWFKCTVKDLEKAIDAIKNKRQFNQERNLFFKMR